MPRYRRFSPISPAITKSYFTETVRLSGMGQRSDGGEEFGVLRSKRTATRYQILVEVAKRQPAVSQQEIADALGITSQAVSDYLGDLAEQ